MRRKWVLARHTWTHSEMIEDTTKTEGLPNDKRQRYGIRQLE